MTDEVHPIDPAVRREIEARLDAIEAEHDVRILFACESGSRGWGFASPDSDYDVRFVHAPRLSWYLQLGQPRDVIELPISDLLDINGWELRKALGLLRKGNATLAEWLQSPVVYRADRTFLEAMSAVMTDVHQPERSFHHYLHMARKTWNEIGQQRQVRLKKYFYVLRPLLAACWVMRFASLPPMRFQALVDGLVCAGEVRTQIDVLLSRKREAAEVQRGERLPVIDAFIAAELGRIEHATPPARRSVDCAPLERLLMDTVLRLEGIRSGG